MVFHLLDSQGRIEDPNGGAHLFATALERPPLWTSESHAGVFIIGEDTGCSTLDMEAASCGATGTYFRTNGVTHAVVREQTGCLAAAASRGRGLYTEIIPG